MAIPLHRLQSGALLLFTFFMISDPKTTPDSRIGRVAFAALVAVGAWYVQFRLFRTNGLLWSLAACSAIVPFIDRLAPGARYTWSTGRPNGLHDIGVGNTVAVSAADSGGTRTVEFDNANRASRPLMELHT